MQENASPSRVAGVVSREVTVAGKTYLLSQPDKVRTAADEEAVILSRRLDMLPAVAKAAAELPPSERTAWRKDYIASMMIGIATPDEWSAYFRSLWHLAFRFWNALDPKHKGNKTLLDGVKWAFELLNDPAVTQEEVDSLWLAINVVSQEEAIKN